MNEKDYGSLVVKGEIRPQLAILIQHGFLILLRENSNGKGVIWLIFS